MGTLALDCECHNNNNNAYIHFAVLLCVWWNDGNFFFLSNNSLNDTSSSSKLDSFLIQSNIESLKRNFELRTKERHCCLLLFFIWIIITSMALHKKTSVVDNITKRTQLILFAILKHLALVHSTESLICQFQYFHFTDLHEFYFYSTILETRRLLMCQNFGGVVWWD